MKRIFTTAIVICLCLWASIAWSNIIHVPGDQPTIQAGIDAAVDGDTVLVADGKYTGFGNKNLDFKGKAIAVTSEHGAESTIIDCENNGRGFYFHSGETSDSAVDGFTITNGTTHIGGAGGGILCQNNSSPTITNNIITGNLGYAGSGISCIASSPMITQNTISGNSADNLGGGILCQDNPSPTITNNIITGNSTGGLGGGVYCYNSSPQIANNTIFWNSADGSGGGIGCYDSSAEITNNIIVGNSAVEFGGGIYCRKRDYPSSPIITYNTITRNSAVDSGGGLYCLNSTPTVLNTILWHDSPEEIYLDGDSSITVTYSDVQGGFLGEGNIDADPKFVDPDNDNYYLQGGSPCLSTANCSGAPETDMDGRPRPLGGGCDMGAYEQTVALIPPKIISSKPEDRARNVDPEKLNKDGIKLEFSQAIDIRNTKEINVMVGGEVLPWVAEWADDKKSVTLLPQKGGELPYQTGVKVAIPKLVDLAGNEVRDVRISFFTSIFADTIPPKIVESDPKDGAKNVFPEKLQIWIKFSEPIDRKRTRINVMIEDEVLGWRLTWLENNQKVILTPLKGGELPYEAEVKIEIPQLVGLAGNEARNVKISFFTSAKSNFELIGFYDALEWPQDITVVGNYAYIAEHGLRIVDVSAPSAPSEVGFYPAPRWGGLSSVEVVDSHAYIVDNPGKGPSEFHVIDVSTPSAPSKVGSLQTNSVAYDITVVGNYAYVADGHGLCIIDISTPSLPSKVGFYEIPIDFCGNCAYRVAIAGNYAYITASWAGGFSIVDVIIPSVPSEVFFEQSIDAYGITVVDNYAYIVGGSGLSVVDVSAPSSPSEVGVYQLPSAGKDITVVDGYAYIAEEKGFRIVDVSIPSSPSEVGFHQTLGIATGVAVSDNLIYVVDIKGGMSILRYTGPAPKAYENLFFTSLKPGLNMISLPLKPIKPYTARSLAEKIDATVVIKLDEERQKFVGFTIDDQDDGFSIEGSRGYIVNVEEGKTVKFEGTAWTNQPPIEAAPVCVQRTGRPPYEERNSAWAFVVNVSMENPEYKIQVKNQSTGVSSMTEASGNGRYSGVWADLTRQPVVKASDVLEVTVSDNTGVVGTMPYTLTKKDIQRAFVTIEFSTYALRPTTTMLYQNYPNPFNPETWIPYQLAKDTTVTIRIYDVKGLLVRTIALGNQKAGVYTTKDKAAYWDGRDSFGEKVASGVYFYTLQVGEAIPQSGAGEFQVTRKMVIVK